MANPVVNRIIRIGRRRGESRKHILAALATGKVESGFRNLPGGDADSQGWRQERASLYRNPRNLKASINRFYDEANQLDRGQGAGRLAADVQRPAAQYRGRYRQALPEVKGLLRGGGGSFAPGADGGRSVTIPGFVREQQTFDRAGYRQAVRRSRVASYLQQQGKGNSILFRSGLLSTEAPDPTDFTGAKLVAGPSSTIRAPGGRGKRGGLQMPRIAPSGKGRVDIASTADRSGASIRPRVVKFVERVADIMGAHLTIGTGTNHSRLTVDGNVSAHWDGNAADVPLRGALLIKAGQDALIAAGMNPRKARRKTGGLFNVGGWQVIFNTHIGGDHTNHLHVGKRR